MQCSIMQSRIHNCIERYFWQWIEQTNRNDLDLLIRQLDFMDMKRSYLYERIAMLFCRYQTNIKWTLIKAIKIHLNSI